MKKLLIIRDVILNKLDKTPGRSGTLLVQQDTTGLHLITLAPNNRGSIDQTNFGMQPGQISELSWLNDDDGSTFWTSKILTPKVAISPPSTITDLAVDYVDAIGARLKWSAPSGNPPDDNRIIKVDRYIIKINNSEISETEDISNMAEYKQTIVPGDVDSPEVLVLTNLTPGVRYYMTVFSEVTLFGKVRRSLKSNTISFITLPVEDDGNIDTLATRIHLEPWQLMGVRLQMTQEDTITDRKYIYNEEKLTPLNGIVDVNGIPEGIPEANRYLRVVAWGSFDPSWYNNPWQHMIVDLASAYNLRYIYIWVEESWNSGAWRFSGSEDGITKITLATETNINNNGWVRVNLNTLLAKNIRYFHLEQGGAVFKVRALIIYGKKSTNNTISGFKLKRIDPSYPFELATGTNALLNEQNVDLIAAVSGITRTYVDGNWLYGPGFRDPGQSQNATDDDVTISPQTSFMWDWDVKLGAWVDQGITPLFCLKNASPYSKPAGIDYNVAMEGKPHNPGLNWENFAVMCDPRSYSQRARVIFNIAARYGTNPDVDRTHIQLAAGNELKVGLGYIKYWEWGNELDARWQGSNRYFSPQEYAAYMSACYDGHKGLLGPSMGVKSADPTAIVIMQGAVSNNTVGQYLEMMKWWDLHRGAGDYPFDAFNAHLYQAFQGPNFSLWSSVPAFAVPPEDLRGEMFYNLPLASAFRDRYAPNKQLWVTETGYDEHNGGVFAPPVNSQFLRSRYKSYWLMRQFIIMMHLGVEVITQYWYANTSIRLEDFNPGDVVRDMFYTTGYTDGVTAYNDTNRKPLMSWHYIKAFRYELRGFKLKHVIRARGVLQTNENFINSADTRLWAFCFGKDDGTTAILIWRDTALMDTSVVKILTHISEPNVNIVRFEDSEIRANGIGLHSSIAVTNDGSGPYISLTVSECPVIVYTKNVGTPRLLDPQQFKAEATSSTAIKLVWEDWNKGMNTVKIFQSDKPSEDFVEIYNDYIDNGEYTVTGLTANTPYYYIIQFQSEGNLSAMSQSVGITTQRQLPVPGNFRSTSQALTTLTLGWDYSSEDAASITGFQIYRSDTINGTYRLVKSLFNTARTFTDIGLIENTSYYYKLRAQRDYSYSPFTLAITATTNPIELISPVPIEAYLEYSGARVILTFDIGIKSAGTARNAFSIMMNYDTTPTLVTVSSIENDPLDPRILILNLATTQTSKGNISLSYDSTLGTMYSVYDIAVDSFNDYIVENKIATSIITRTWKASFNSAAPSDWNTLSPIGINSQIGGDWISHIQFSQSLKDTNGVTSGVNFVMTWNDDTPNKSRLGAGVDVINAPNPLSDTTDFFAGAIAKGVDITFLPPNGTDNYIDSYLSTIIVNGLDTSKTYSVKLLFRKNDAGSWDSPWGVRYFTYDGNPTKTPPTTSVYGISNGVNENGVKIVSKPRSLNIPYHTGDGWGVVAGMGTPMVDIRLAATKNDGGGQSGYDMKIAAIIIEEIQ